MGRLVLTEPGRERAKKGKSLETGRPKARGVSQRKELAVVTLGMVAAISGVGGLLAANPPSWAATPAPAAVTAQETPDTRGQEEAEQAARRASEEAARQEEAAREAEARVEAARKESGRAAQQNEAQQAGADQAAAEQAATEQAAEQYAAEQAAAQAAAEQAAVEQQQQATFSAEPQGTAAAVSQGS